MTLTPEQEQRVAYLVEDQWHGWCDFNAALKPMSAEELHAFADRINWDGGGADRLMRVLKHPKCDRGTALMIYWRADPVYDLRFASRDEVKAKTWPARVDEWDMCRHIEARLAHPQSFATARIPYNPANDRGRDRTKPPPKKTKPVPLYEFRDGKIVTVGFKDPPNEPKVDVRTRLPAVVFEPVTG